MSDHLAAAQRYRDRAIRCEFSAKNTSSVEFGECYRLLAQHYLVLADLEENCARRPFAAHQADNRPADKPSTPARMFAVRQLQTAPPAAVPMAIDQMPVPEFVR